MTSQQQEAIRRTQEHIQDILQDEFARIERMKKAEDYVDYDRLETIIIGIAGGDGIGPFIASKARDVLERLLAEEREQGHIEFKTIEGLTIENRAHCGQAIPEDVLSKLKQCHLILKGPTTTPRKGDRWPNIESANVAMRRELDLFANVRPVKVPEEKIDWVFFRENTEGAYILGSRGIQVTDELALDFKVITSEGADRIIRAAFEYASRNNRQQVTVVTKANVVKTSDGLFLRRAQEIASEYPGIDCNDWYIDIMAAKLLDPARRSDFDVFVMPNLYGDILTDEAAQIQGGVGTAGSANIGKRYAMFEAIHGSAPRMVEEGRARYADPSSMMRAAALLLEHIGMHHRARRLEMALDICNRFEKKVVLTGRPGGADAEEFTSYVIDTLQGRQLETTWSSYMAAFD